MINYILLPVFVLFFLVYKFWNKTKLVKLEEMDIWTGRRELLDPEMEAIRRPRSCWDWVMEVVVG